MPEPKAVAILALATSCKDVVIFDVEDDDNNDNDKDKDKDNKDDNADVKVKCKQKEEFSPIREATRIDRTTTLLNACSLEVLHRRSRSRSRSRSQRHISLSKKDDGEENDEKEQEENHNDNDNDNDDSDSDFVLQPLVIGCYQLNEAECPESLTTTTKTDEKEAEGDDNDAAAAAAAANVASNPTRSGELRLYLIDAMAKTSKTLPAFGNPVQVVETDSGVLDGKWRDIHDDDDNADYDEDIGECDNNENEHGLDDMPLVSGRSENAGSVRGRRWRRRPRPRRRRKDDHALFGTASASGRVHVYSLSCGGNDENDDSSAAITNGWLRRRQQWRLDRLVSSSVPPANEGGKSTNRLCLSLDWDAPRRRRRSRLSVPAYESADGSRQRRPMPRRPRHIVSSYSDGTLAVHSVTIDIASDGSGETETTNTDDPCRCRYPRRRRRITLAEMQEVRSWTGHRMFGVPAEVWTTCFVDTGGNGAGADSMTDNICDDEQINNSENEISHSPPRVVASGGDDRYLKLWDLRTDLKRPIVSIGENEFNAGVTAVAKHPRLPHVLASGSYDEVVRFWDVRNMSEPLCRVHVGGGVWRVKWHPCIDGMVLIAAMHGGCRVVFVDGLGNRNCDNDYGVRDKAAAAAEWKGVLGAKVVSEFKQHGSMAYGADWVGAPKFFGYECDSDSVGFDNDHGHSFVAASCSFYDRQAFLWDGGDGSS